MAVKLLQVLLLGVIAAAADDDVPVSWVPSPRAALQCQIPDAERIPARRPPPPLEADDRPRSKPYLWRRGAVELKRVSNNGTLEVFRRKDNEGVYQCSVRRPTGYVLGYPVNLKFAYLEKQFSVQPANATAWRGQPYALRCDIVSAPAALVSWLKDGKLLPVDYNRYYLLNNQLLIASVTDDDAGLYRCRATNPIVNKSRTSHGGRLQVDDPPEDLSPSFFPVLYETNITAQRGTNVTLPCPVVGDQDAKLIWELTPPNSRTSELENTEQILVLQNTELDHEGVYTCRVEGNSHLVKTFNVTITVPVNITDPPKSKQSVRAGTVRFNCTASGKPTPKVTWYKDGKELKLAGRIDVVLSADDKKLPQLLIRSVTSEDAGIYQCFAHNSISVASSWATLNVTGAEAAAPGALRCLPTGARDVLVKWTKVPAPAVVVAYIVMTTMPDGNSLPGQPVKITEAPISVKSPLTPYGFQVRAFISSQNSNKDSKDKANVVSDMSEIVTCQGQGVPIKLSKVDDDSILVSWRNFFEENPGIAQWILQYKTENGSDEHTNITLDGYQYNYTLKVSPSEPLQVRVLGTRSLPWLQQNLTLVPWTASSAAGHYAGPGEVRAVPEDVEVTEVNARDFTVRWRFEDDSLLKSYTYFVCTRRVGGNEECMNSTKNWARVINLQPNSEYEVRVQARIPGQALGGDFSVPIQISTKTDGQGNSRELTYKYLNATAVRVSWNSDPREYIVRYTDDFNLPLNQWSAVKTIGNTVVLSELDPTKELHVMVEGHEPVGHSPRLTVPAQIPVAKDLQYTYTRSGLMVTWKGEGPRVVRYSQNLTQTLDKWPTINVTATSVELTGLEPALPTFVMVAAPGPSQHNQVLTINPRPPDHYNVYLGVGIGCGVLLLCLLIAAGFCIWQKRKRSRSPVRTRRRPSNIESTEEEGSEMKNVGGRLANGGGSKDAGEPLLNGHVHITENPSQSKTPNGKVRKGKYEPTFDVARYGDGDGDADVTVETVLDDTTTGFSLLDTSRRPEFDDRVTRDRDIHQYDKLPDDNMNELTRAAHFPLENSKILPTLQPNG